MTLRYKASVPSLPVGAPPGSLAELRPASMTRLESGKPAEPGANEAELGRGNR